MVKSVSTCISIWFALDFRPAILHCIRSICLVLKLSFKHGSWCWWISGQGNSSSRTCTNIYDPCRLYPCRRGCWEVFLRTPLWPLSGTYSSWLLQQHFLGRLIQGFSWRIMEHLHRQLPLRWVLLPVLPYLHLAVSGPPTDTSEWNLSSRQESYQLVL